MHKRHTGDDGSNSPSRFYLARLFGKYVPILVLNRASPISEIEDMDLPALLYYGRMWEEEGRRTKAMLDKLEK